MTKAVWYFDFISPFAYLQWQELARLPESLKISHRPVLFAGLLNHWGHKGPAEIPAKRRHTYRYCRWLAEQRNIPFTLPPAHPFNPLKALRLAVALGEDGQAISAEAHYRRLLQVTDWEVRAGWRLAELLATNEARQDEAEALLQQTLSKSPNLRPALWRLARLLHEAGRHEEALVPLERLRALIPQDYRAYHLLASVYEHLGQSHLAADSYLTYERLQRQATIHRRVSDQALGQAQRLAKR